MTKQTEDFLKVLKTIKSCKTQEQLYVASAMYDNYKYFHKTYEFNDAFCEAWNDKLWSLP